VRVAPELMTDGCAKVTRRPKNQHLHLVGAGGAGRNQPRAQ
jgi:hypothetical protein